MAKPKKTVIEYRNYELPLNFPVLLLTGDRWHISDVKSGKLHFHNCLEIGICHTDSGYIEFGNTPVTFKAGDMTFISRNVPHTTYSSKGEASLWSYIFIQPDELLKGMYSDSSPYANIFVDMLQNSQLIINREKYPDIYFILKTVMEELEQKGMNYQISVKGLMLSLFMKLMRIYAEECGKKSDNKVAHDNAIVISPALDYIKENYMMNFPIEELADMCHLSQTHFRRVFHEIMNTSPLNYLNTTRILQSCILLRTTEESILTISEQVGFRSVSSYNRHFSEIMGTQPSDWRHKMARVDKASILEYTGWMQAQNLSDKKDR
ncbi:AraC family transcriptional regulator [Butyrivibrio sp. YAB3001]|uniref:AraC family transcriptional regulator n=1 Tax=Butyrivibrio sp. YAB3001 TaxID=1520812 RepID=UPI0008F67E93|nr:AraC family transcriptional regulator [Butyrivibrio sp. YAB3001]SFD10187.1 AraC-type DNA-binding protein [Butyrivibrio sp. YAB3001]